MRQRSYQTKSMTALAKTVKKHSPVKHQQQVKHLHMQQESEKPKEKQNA